MKKTKILLVGALLLGVPSVALSLSTQQENPTVVRAETHTATMTSFTSVTSNNIGGDKNVSYSCEKGGGTSAPAINNGVIRLYQIGTGESEGGLITIKSVDGCVLTSVTIGSSMATSIAYTINSETTKSTTTTLAENGKSTVNLSDKSATSITFYCMGEDKNTRLYVNYLSATYDVEEKTLISEIQNVETQTKLKFDYTKTVETEIKDIASTTFDFSSMNLTNGEEANSFDNDGFSVLFDKGNNQSQSNGPKYYDKGNAIRVYASNTIKISGTSAIKSIKLELTQKNTTNKITTNYGTVTDDLDLTRYINNINSNELTITVGGGTTGHLRVQKIIINENYTQEEVEIVNYSNFSNLQLQYQYSFDVSSYNDEVQEIGMFVTDDANFEFNTDGIYDDELTFESQVSKDDGCTGLRFINFSKKETYTIGINLGNEIEGAILTTFRVGTYVKTNNKYYFSTKTSEYNLETVLEKYNTMELEGEGNAVIASFLAYVKTL